MLKFCVFQDGQPATDWPLRNAYLVGTDSNAVRANLSFREGVILCDKHESGSAAFALQYPCDELGELTIQTCLLPEREEPYNLVIELARHRLMMLYVKLEDWAMFDLEPDHPVTQRSNKARTLFIEALCAQNENPAEAAQRAHQSLTLALDGTEELALAHSELLLARRKLTGSLPKSPLGCGVHPTVAPQQVRSVVETQFDFAQLPCPWKLLCPEEGETHWQIMDAWTQWARRQQVPLIVGPLVSFDPSNLPDWIYIWEHDYDTVRDLIYEHIERVVTRYRTFVPVWNVVSGLHVNDHFTFNFEQLMDLTRMATMLVRKIQPAARLLVELRQPFGEYYATNQRSIPPMMYADLLVQSGIGFDAFSLHLPMGQAQPGQFARDLMQISNLIDQFGQFGKPLLITLGAPSEPVTSAMLPADKQGRPADDNAGHWRRPWSGVVQSHWLEAVFQIAMSKPFVESVAWQELVDHPNIELPLSGLVNEALVPKESLGRMASFRKHLTDYSDNQETLAGQSVEE